MSEKRIFKDFDLPTNHLPGNQHYVPPKARTADEVARRRELRRGTLLIEKQASGLSMAGLILDALEEPEDIRFAAKVLAISGLNSAWYIIGRGSEAEVMRRRLKLPILATGDPALQPDVMSLLPSARARIRGAVPRAHVLVAAHEHVPAKVADLKKEIARSVGTASIELACVARSEMLGRNNSTVSDSAAQNFVRQSGLWVLHHGRTTASEIGSYASMAQLSDRDSDLSVFWRRNAPNGAVEAYEAAVESPLAA